MKKSTRLISALLAALLLFTLQLTDLSVGFAASSPYAIICDNCEALNESLDVIRSACPGDKVFVRFRRQDMPDGKYTTQDIISDDVTVTKDPNGVQSFIMPAKSVHLSAALFDRKSGSVDLSVHDRVNADFTLLDSLIFTQKFDAYAAAQGNGEFVLDLNKDGVIDVTVILSQKEKTAAARREKGSDDITESVKLPIHYTDGLDWSREYKECVFNVAREYCFVSFRANGGSRTMNSVKVAKGAMYTLPQCKFKAPKGKCFVSWDKGYPGTQIEITENTVLTARWKTITRIQTKITAQAKTFKAKLKTKKYTIMLRDKNGKPVKKAAVTLTVGGKTYKAKTNNKGKATFKITKLTQKGNYTALIKYAGNSKYKPCTKKVKIKIKK